MPSRVLRSRLRQIVIQKDRALRAELTATMSEIGNDIKQRHLQVVRDWKHQPRFVVGYNVTPAAIFVHVYPDGRNAVIWGYVDQGTKPHAIYPRVRGTKLKFRTGYEAKTAPIAQFNQGSGQANGPWVSKDFVQHPGTEARKFSETIEQAYRPLFVRKIENAFRRALR